MTPALALIAALLQVGDTSIFAPLALPAPTEYRAASGAPGEHYWQNRADYDIAVRLDTASRSIYGRLTLTYTNHSPDTLRYLWFQLDQNAFKPGSLSHDVYDIGGARFGGPTFNGGEHILKFEQIRGTTRIALTTRLDDTELKADLAQPLAPGGAAIIAIEWHMPVPENGMDKMGRDGALYEIAQWYPRVAVYDDLRGWNIEPYLGQGEFYLEYGDFTYAVTVPAGYIVCGTGTLTNPLAVLSADERARLAAAAHADTVTPIIRSTTRSTRAKRDGMLTWTFAAKNVRDIAWAASPDYQWDATSWHGIMAYAFYRPSATDTWSGAADMARATIKEYSTRWFPYPYPQITVVEGPVAGQEYPMFAMEGRFKDQYALYAVIAPIVGHNWMPMIVGSNERLHFWQDEGLNTWMASFAEGARYPEKGDQFARVARERELVTRAESLGVDTPTEIPSDRVPTKRLTPEEYLKPSVALELLRQNILGPVAFDDAFRTYIRRWAYKHPTPSDFFRTMEDAGGKRLDWFWREMFVENDHFDQAIDSVSVAGDSVTVTYGNRARGVLPIRARFTFSDGTTAEYSYPADVWIKGRQYTRTYVTKGKTITRIELDPDHRLIDIDRSNNVWSVSGSLSSTQR
ncbi:MAG TPA: M1 family metallopeptidase [Gemmatimonadaceae bacterium]|nr:M1 family metallopeptidase [Gemmatimonadaceae bacterium]